MDDFEFDFETSLPQREQNTRDDSTPQGQQQQGNLPRNYRQTVCTYWLRGLCMKGDTCGFLHQFDPERMPVCRNLLKYGQCKEPDCPYKHTTDEIKECNMYKLGFCIYGPACRFKHTRQTGPPPDPELLEACKPRELRNITIVANQANEGVLKIEERAKQQRHLLEGHQQESGAMIAVDGQAQRGPPVNAPGFLDESLLAAVGQRDLRYGF